MLFQLGRARPGVTRYAYDDAGRAVAIFDPMEGAWRVLPDAASDPLKAFKADQAGVFGGVGGAPEHSMRRRHCESWV